MLANAPHGNPPKSQAIDKTNACTPQAERPYYWKQHLRSSLKKKLNLCLYKEFLLLYAVILSCWPRPLTTQTSFTSTSSRSHYWITWYHELSRVCRSPGLWEGILFSLRPFGFLILSWHIEAEKKKRKFQDTSFDKN